MIFTLVTLFYLFSRRRKKNSSKLNSVHILALAIKNYSTEKITRKSSSGKPQEAYRPPCSKSGGEGYLPWPGGGGSYLGEGVTYPGVSSILTRPGGTYFGRGYLPWTGVTYVGLPPSTRTDLTGGYLPWSTPFPWWTD